ncbi:MAG: ATP-binding protein [Patescibacteria group bacterium]
MKTFIISVGLPGAGKTTAVASEFPNAVVISPDNFIGYTEENPWTSLAARAVWKKADSLLVEAFEREDELIVFDATFPKSKKRKKYINKAIDNGYKVWALYCPCPLKVSLARNIARPKFRGVPKWIIENMNSNLEVPTKEEGFEKVLTFNSVTNKLMNNI